MSDFTIVNLQDLETATGLTENDLLAIGQGDKALAKATIQQVGAFLGITSAVKVGDKNTAPTEPSFAFAEAGTYTEWGNVEIIGDLGILIFDGTNFSKTEINFVANGVVEEGNTQAVSGGEVYDYVTTLGTEETVIIGKNKFDTSTLQHNKYINPTTGLLVDNTNPAATWQTYGPFDLSEADTWTFSNKRGGGNIMWYDENDIKVGSKIDLSYPPSGILQTTGNTQTRPVNAKYVRYDAVVSTIPLEELQIEMGSAKTAYEPYSEEVIRTGSPATDLINEMIDDKIRDLSKIEPNKIINTRRALLVNVTPVGQYIQRIALDFYKSGILHENISAEGFINNVDSLKYNYDTIVLCDTNFDYDVNFTLLQFKEALSEYIDYGCKVVWLYQSNSSGLQITKNQYTGYTGETLSVADLFDTNIVKSAKAFGSSELLFNDNDETTHSLLNTECRASGTINSFGATEGCVRPFSVTNGTDTVYPVIIKKNKFAIVAYCNIISGDNNKSATWKYMDYGKLLLELSDISTTDRIAIGYRYGYLVAGIGVDADYAKDKIAIENIADATKDYALEIGYVTSNLDKDKANYFRNMNFRYPKLKHGSHTKYHYSLSSKTQITDEVHVIPSNGIITLKYPVKAIIDSVNSIDGLTTFTRISAPFRYANPTTEQYACDFNLPNELFNGKIKFNRSLAGTEVKISYRYTDDYDDVGGSINDINNFGLMSSKFVYTTMGSNSISPSTFLQCEIDDIILSEYLNFPNNFRTNLIANGINKPFVTINGNMLQTPNGSSGDDVNLLKNYSFSQFTNDVLPYIVNRAVSLEIPFIGYIHDMLISETYGGSVWISPIGTYNADWKKATVSETTAYLKNFYKTYFDTINSVGVHWDTRSSYCEFYNFINKGISYEVSNDGDVIRLYVRNNSNELLRGVTFKVNSNINAKSVIRLESEKIPYRFENNEIILWCDISPNVSEVIEIRL